MDTGIDLEEYMAEIREQVCSRCIERRAGTPPCAPLGKNCGIELNLPQIIEAVHGVHSRSMDQYIIRLHNDVCAHCSALDSESCTCPLRYLLLLAVEAIEEVDARRAALLQSVDA
jgi:hypothetical protein